jgi:hypothetical protein
MSSRSTSSTRALSSLTFSCVSASVIGFGIVSAQASGYRKIAKYRNQFDICPCCKVGKTGLVFSGWDTSTTTRKLKPDT